MQLPGAVPRCFRQHGQRNDLWQEGWWGWGPAPSQRPYRSSEGISIRFSTFRLLLPPPPR